MIQKQIPLPIPIFNLAIPIHPASNHGVSHVQQYEDILYCNLQCRLRKQRLVQWVRMPLQTEYERTPTVPSSFFSYRINYVQRHGYTTFLHPLQKKQQQQQRVLFLKDVFGLRYLYYVQPS